MADREKVIKGLECCILRNPDDHARCAQCSCYVNRVNRLKVDVLELIRRDEQMIASLQNTIYKLTKAVVAEPPGLTHGHWKVVQGHDDDEHWQCSACGCGWYLKAGDRGKNCMRYCSECGAKMDEEVMQDADE